MLNETIGNKVSIMPFTDGVRNNGGLEKYNMIIHEGTKHEEQLMCLEVNGVKRYVTGLNEFAPEVQLLPMEEKEAKIKEIRKTVAHLERVLNSNVVEIDDVDFWKKVTLVNPNNHDFWGKITIKCGNNPLFLEPGKDPNDLILYCAIKAGGFTIVAKSYDDARSSGTQKRFYMDEIHTTASIKTEVTKLRNKAGGELQKLFDKNQNKLFLVAKNADPNSLQYNKSTSNDVLYENMDKFINGQLMEKDKRKTAERFIELCNMDMNMLKLRAIAKDADKLKLIITKGDGYIYHIASSSLMGRNMSDVVEFLNNPLNEDVLNNIRNEVEKLWNI